MTNDDCNIRLLPGAEKSLGKIARLDAERLGSIEDTMAHVVENGWILSVHSGLIKVLDQRRHIGEIRDLGGGYRLFFFWRTGRRGRRLYITAIEKKSKLKGKARLNAFIDAAYALRRRYFGEPEGRDE
ncbi:MAG TPA: hypothetical protein VFR37_08810 [Longimicrobium sp.]|nr:hypothetical protein [Longimicrobium sp.]